MATFAPGICEVIQGITSGPRWLSFPPMQSVGLWIRGSTSRKSACITLSRSFAAALRGIFRLPSVTLAMSAFGNSGVNMLARKLRSICSPSRPAMVAARARASSPPLDAQYRLHSASDHTRVALFPRSSRRRTPAHECSPAQTGR